MLQLALFARRESRHDNLASCRQYDLTVGNEGKLLSNLGIDFVPDSHKSKLFLVVPTSRRNGTEKYPVEAPAGIPPGRILSFLQGRRQMIAGFACVQSCPGDVKSHDFPAHVAEEEQVAACQLPERHRSILDSGRVPGRHQRLQRWELGEQCGRS